MWLHNELVMLRSGRRSLLRGIPVQSIERNLLDLRACSGARDHVTNGSNGEASLLYGGDLVKLFVLW